MDATTDFEVVFHRTPEGVVLAPAGELDLATAAPFLASCVEALGANPGQVIIELDTVEFIDAAGLGALVRAREVAASRGIQMRFDKPSPRCRQLLELTELDGLLDCAEALCGGA